VSGRPLTISGTTRLIGLIGYPVDGSLSPRMQNAAFAELGLDYAYVALPVETASVADAVRGVGALGFAGANVTAPHKGAAATVCDTLDGVAARAESVNTIVVDGGRLIGSSTDAAILEDVPARHAVVLGAGGSARAFQAALEARGTEVRVFSRSGDWPPQAAGADLVVNATPLVDDVLVELTAAQTVIDLPYRAGGEPTALAEAAGSAGARLVDGLEVLVRQGAASFERWTGVPAPVGAMRAALGLPP
jgi:shikimate dehydrogenase